MDKFGISSKKFLSLSEHSQNRYLSKWLETYYHETINNKCSLEHLELLYQKYTEKFLLHSKLTKPKTNQEWIEFFSNRFHYHRQKLSQKLAEADFLSNPKNLGHPNEILNQKQETINWTVVLDNIRSSFNIGSVFRTVDGAGWEKVLLSGYSSTPAEKYVQKTAMQSSNWVKWEYTKNLKRWLKSQSLPIIGLETRPEAQNYFYYSWQKAGILILGNEEYGIAESILELCHSVVSIPMYGKKISLNLANAFAIVAYHLRNNF